MSDNVMTDRRLACMATRGLEARLWSAKFQTPTVNTAGWNLRVF